MINKLFIAGLVLSLCFTSCNHDDSTNEISLEVQNTQDDKAIEKLLKDYYFNADTGKMTKFVNDNDSSTDDDEWDDSFTPIYDIATKLPSGVWIAKNPNVIEGSQMVTNHNTQEIYISYNLNFFTSSVDSENAVTYLPLNPFLTTLNSGVATWTNPFYLIKEDLIADGKTESFYEMEGIQEGIKQFKATGRTVEDTPVYQGIIVVPSRLAYARDTNYLSSSYGLPTNATMILNFELLSIRDL